MNSLEQNGGSRVKSRNVIQYASDKINELAGKDTMEGIKKIVAIDRIVKEAELMHIAEKEKIYDSNSNRTPIVTGTEIEDAYKAGEYRPIIEEQEK